MKFVCDKCNTKYSIADERVAGRVLKIRCKSCNHTITVTERGTQAEPSQVVNVPTAASPTASRATGSTPAVKSGINQQINQSFGQPQVEQEATMLSTEPAMTPEWFVSFDGNQEGPLTLEKARERVRLETGRGRESHAWKAGFAEWLPVGQITELAPRKKTPPPPIPARPAAAPPRVPMQAVQAATKPATSNTGPVPKREGSVSQPMPKREGSVSQPMPKREGSVSQPMPKREGSVSQPMPRREPSISQPVPRREGSVSQSMPRGEPSGAHAIPAQIASSQITKDPTGPRAALAAVPSGRTGTTGKHAHVDANGSSPKRSPSQAIPEISALAAQVSTVSRTQNTSGSQARVALPVPESQSDPLQLDSDPTGGGGIEDMLIDEPSRVLQVNDAARFALRQSASSIAAAPSAAPAATPAGKTIEAPAPRVTEIPIAQANGVHATAAPVVVHQRSSGPGGLWKAIAVFGLIMTLGLGGTVVYMLFRWKPIPPVKAEDIKIIASTESRSREVVDQPITVPDDPNPTPGKSKITASAQGGTAPVAPGKKLAPPPVGKGATPPPAPQAGAKPTTPKGKAAANSGLFDDLGEHDAHGLAGHSEHRASGGSGEVSQQAIAQVVTQNRKSLQLCYDRMLKLGNATPKKGRIVAHLKIGVSGRVINAQIIESSTMAELDTCISGMMKKWNFPSNDAEYEFEFPLILQATN